MDRQGEQGEIESGIQIGVETEIKNLDPEGEEKAEQRNGSKGPGPDPRRGHHTRTGSIWSRGLSRPSPRRAVMEMGTPTAGALPVARPDAHIGGLMGPPETRCSQRQLGLFPHKPPPPASAPAPFPWPWSRGDPELEKTPRQAPRPGAANRETGKCQGSAKP